jgi:hypothetical protein
MISTDVNWGEKNTKRRKRKREKTRKGREDGGNK